jgi:hypothetical protein
MVDHQKLAKRSVSETRKRRSKGISKILKELLILMLMAKAFQTQI